MSHYRKITVEGKLYTFKVTRTVTKVTDTVTKKSTRYENSEWGTPHIGQDFSDRFKGDRSITVTPIGFIITPGDIRGMILGKRRWQDKPCAIHPEYTITGLQADCASAELDHKTVLVGNCPACSYESGMSI